MLGHFKRYKSFLQNNNPQIVTLKSFLVGTQPCQLGGNQILEPKQQKYKEITFPSWATQLAFRAPLASSQPPGQQPPIDSRRKILWQALASLWSLLVRKQIENISDYILYSECFQNIWECWYIASSLSAFGPGIYPKHATKANRAQLCSDNFCMHYVFCSPRSSLVTSQF